MTDPTPITWTIADGEGNPLRRLVTAQLVGTSAGGSVDGLAIVDKVTGWSDGVDEQGAPTGVVTFDLYPSEAITPANTCWAFTVDKVTPTVVRYYEIPASVSPVDLEDLDQVEPIVPGGIIPPVSEGDAFDAPLINAEGSAVEWTPITVPAVAGLTAALAAKADVAGAPLHIDARSFPIGNVGDVDEVEIILADHWDEQTDVILILLPDRPGPDTDVSAVLTIPDEDHRPISVQVFTEIPNAQLAIKVRFPFFVSSVAGGLGFSSVQADLERQNITGVRVAGGYLLSDLVDSQFMWLGTRGSITSQGTEYGILHSGQTEDYVDAIAAAAEVDLGAPVDPDLVADIKAALLDKLDDGNQPVSENFAANKAGLAIEALVKLTMTQQAGSGVALGETSTTAYRGDRGKTAYDHSQLTTGNPHSVTAAQVGAPPTSRTLAGLDLSADRTAAALRTALTLVVGTDVQAYHAALAAIATAGTSYEDRILILCAAQYPSSLTGSWTETGGSMIGGGYAATGTTNDQSFTYSRLRLRGGTYSMRFRRRTGSTSGIATITLGGVAVGTADGYSAGNVNDAAVTFTGITVAEGFVDLVVTNPTKNATATNYVIQPQLFDIWRTGA